MSESTTYKFKTFQELVDVVPADKIGVCLSEIAEALATAKEVALAGYAMLGVPAPASVIQLPTEFEWVDDGKGEITAHLIAKGQSDPFLTVTTKPK